MPLITRARDVFKVEYMMADFKAPFYAESKNRAHFFLTRRNFEDTSSYLKCIEQYYNSIYQQQMHVLLLFIH